MPADLSAGATIGGFRIESPLARGAMAEVYRARDGNGRPVALKLLDPALAHDQRFRQRFVRESELAATLSHPNIVATLASGEDSGRLYLALELVDGPDLGDVLRREGRLDPERAVALLEQVAAGLDAAHAAGLVHRDVKPGNIVVRTREGAEQASICDFGLARHVSSVSSLTGERGFVGTIDYVPPEQIEGGAIDSRADVYSLGCVLYECLAGRRPFERDSELSVVFAHLNEPPPLLTDVRPELPAAFDEVIATVLAKSPDERYSSAGELAAAARAALQGEVLARRKPRRRVLIAGAGVAAAVAAAVAVSLAILLPSDSESEPVTITPTSIRGARLGDSSALLERMWGNGYQLLQMQFPPSYTLLTVRSRNLSAFFAGTDDKAVELVTANRADRTAQGIGPCSTLADLRRVYGNRLKPSPNSTSPDGKLIFGWTVGKHLFFAMGPGPDELAPNEQPTRVETVALYSDELGNAGFNAANAAPCTAAVDSTPVVRPASLPAVKKPALAETLAARRFVPNLSVRAPAGWRVRSNDASGYTIASPTGGTVAFRLDPAALGADGRPLANVSRTANGIATWLKNNKSLAVTGPAMSLLGHPALTVFRLDVEAAASSGAPYLGFPRASSTLRVDPRRPVRLYLAIIRIDALVHTLAVTVEAQSASALRSLRPIVQSILGSLRVKAAAVQPVLPLSVLCTPVFYGTCRGELDAGTHSTSTLRPKLTYTVPVGWTNSGDQPGYMGLIPPGGDRGAVDIGKSDFINVFTRITTGNERCADGHGTARTPEDLVRWFRDQPGIAPFTAKRVSIGGLDGLVVDLRMRRGWKAPCPWSRGFPAQQVITGLDPSPDEMNHGLLPQPMVMRLYLLRYKGGTLAIEIDEVRGDSKLPAYSKVVESFRFTPS